MHQEMYNKDIAAGRIGKKKDKLVCLGDDEVLLFKTKSGKTCCFMEHAMGGKHQVCRQTW